MAVVKDLARAEDADKIRKGVRDGLGPDYELEDVKSLADLGFETWPLNQTGKVVKREFRDAYMRRFAS